MWTEYVSEISADVEFSPPADQAITEAIESALDFRNSVDLQQLLAESNGMTDQYGVEFVWSAEQITSKNREMRDSQDFRSLYMPFDHLLFFGDNGGGDQFALVPGRSDVFAWQHESDSRIWVANDLRDYLRRYLEADGEDWYAP